MAWGWYPVKKVDEVMAQGTPDETVTAILDQGEEEIRFIQGFSVGLIFRGFMLFPNLNDRNPFAKKNGDVEVGAMIYDGQYWVGVNEGDE